MQKKISALKHGFMNDKKTEIKIGKSRFVQFLLIVLILLLCMSGSYFVTDKVMKNMARKNTLNSNRKIMQQIDAKASEFHNFLYGILTLLAYERTAYDYFDQTARERLENYDDLSAMLSNIMLIQNDIAGISLYDANGVMLAETGKNFDIFNRVSMEKELVYSDMFRPNSSSDMYFTVSYPVYDLLHNNYDKQIGMIVLVMREERFSAYVADTAITEHEKLYLMDRRNVVIAGSERRDFLLLKDDDLVSGAGRYVEVLEQKETGWKIISIIPQKELYSGLKLVRESVLVIYLITLSGLVLLLYFCYFLILKPIRRIDFFVRRSVESPSSRLLVKGSDEVSLLASNLNKMLDEKDEMSEKLRHAQRELYEVELAKQQMQVLAYRNQINPHFLYNTFECIRAMALYYEAEEIEEITLALSHIFRYAIKGENVVTVDEEIKNIKEYGKIIHYRFGGRIRVEVKVDSSTRERKLIKLILQPIVENSIFHGLEQKVGEGIVRVEVRSIGEKGMELDVEDDGCGMDEKQVERLIYQMRRQSLHRSSQKGSIGLSNIYNRLKLFYGEKAELYIKSKPDQGTRVRIVIPNESGINPEGEKNV